MKDSALETDLRLLSLQVESWKKLHNFISYALDKSKPLISVVQEGHFTETRSILLQESEHVFEELNIVEEAAGKTMMVLQRATSMRGVRELPGEEARRLEMDWNAVFTKLGVLQGQLKARRKGLRTRSAFSVSLGRVFGQRATAS